MVRGPMIVAVPARVPASAEASCASIPMAPGSPQRFGGMRAVPGRELSVATRGDIGFGFHRASAPSVTPRSTSPSRTKRVDLAKVRRPGPRWALWALATTWRARRQLPCERGAMSPATCAKTDGRRRRRCRSRAASAAQRGTPLRRRDQQNGSDEAATAPAARRGTRLAAATRTRPACAARHGQPGHALAARRYAHGRGWRVGTATCALPGAAPDATLD